MASNAKATLTNKNQFAGLSLDGSMPDHQPARRRVKPAQPAQPAQPAEAKVTKARRQDIAPVRSAPVRPAQQTTRRPAQRRAVTSEPKVEIKFVQAVPTLADFPTIGTGRPADAGLWSNTRPIHAAAHLPDPAIQKRKEQEEHYRLIAKYRTELKVEYDDMDLDMDVSSLIQQSEDIDLDEDDRTVVMSKQGITLQSEDDHQPLDTWEDYSDEGDFEEEDVWDSRNAPRDSWDD